VPAGEGAHPHCDERRTAARQTFITPFSEPPCKESRTGTYQRLSRVGGTEIWQEFGDTPHSARRRGDRPVLLGTAGEQGPGSQVGTQFPHA